MWHLVVPICIIVTANALTSEIYNGQSIIDKVNSADTTWKAGVNFSPDIPVSYIKHLLGKKKSTNSDVLPTREKHEIPDTAIPESFDARLHWPGCPTIKHIRDQGVCGSCWAVAGASTLTDRFCIATRGLLKKSLSAEELLSCCGERCGDGCNGGELDKTWKYFQTDGIVTGGDYHSRIGCQPYQVQPCEHHSTGQRPECANLPYQPTPPCVRKCINNLYSVPYETDHHKTKRSYVILNDSKEIQKEILLNGPVEAGFVVYADFPTYKLGVYKYVTGDPLGGHAVKIIGWGTEKNTPYWLIANSWNTDWGDKGFFKILRGSNECGIEEEITAGEPQV